MATPAERVQAVLQSWNPTIRGLYNEGLTLTLLEDNDVPILRGLEGSPCDAALLIDDVAQGETRIGLTYRCLENNISVIPFDLKSVTTSLENTNRPRMSLQATRGQKRHVQFLLVTFEACPFVRALIPQPLFEVPNVPTSWSTAYASTVPSIIANCIVRCEDLPEALRNVRDCVNDPEKSYVNPTTLVEFPAGLFQKVASRCVLGDTSTSKQRQLRRIYDAVSQHEGFTFDCHLIPSIISDFVIRMADRNVSFETRLNSYNVAPNRPGIMIHHINRNRMLPAASCRRLFHHTQTFHYLFTQVDDEAYVIPVGVLPDAWYISENRYGEIPFAEIASYHIDLSKDDWVTKLVSIVDDTWDMVGGQPGKARPLRHRTFVPQATETVIETDIDIIASKDEESYGATLNEVGPDEDEVLGDGDLDIVAWMQRVANGQPMNDEVGGVSEVDHVYLHLLRLCASRRSGMILPLYLCPVSLYSGSMIPSQDHESYIMFSYRWSYRDVEDFDRDRKLPCSLDQLGPYQRVIPITILRRTGHDNRAAPATLTLNIRDLGVIAQPFKQTVIISKDINALDTNLAVIPSEFIQPKEGVFKTGVQTAFKQWQKGKNASFAHNIWFDEIIDQLPMHFMYPLMDITALILNCFRPLGSSGEGGCTFREGVKPADKGSYVCQYKGFAPAPGGSTLRSCRTQRKRVRGGR